jgi:hypothetical protein
MHVTGREPMYIARESGVDGSMLYERPPRTCSCRCLEHGHRRFSEPKQHREKSMYRRLMQTEDPVLVITSRARRAAA